MKFKQVIFSGIFWRGLYFATVLLLNIIVSRYFQAKGSGWIYYITNYFSFIILVASLSLESGITFFASGNTINHNKLAVFALAWSILVSFLIVLSFFLYYKDPEQEFTRKQLIFFSGTYITGILLSTFFSALFYARQNFKLPNLLFALVNVLLIISLPVIITFNSGQQARGIFLKLFFLNFLLQGVLLSGFYFIKNRHFFVWSLPKLAELKLLFRYSFFALLANLVFFLLYRIDYWFIKNICTTCKQEDLGNYIQVSKLGQIFLVVPGIISSTLFPRTAAGFGAEVNNLLPVLIRMMLFVYFILMLVLAVTGYWLFPSIYGRTFDNMYIPFLLLMPGILALSSVAFLSAYYAGKNKVIINLKGSALALVVVITGDLLFIPYFGIRAAALVSSIAYLICFLYTLIVFRKEYAVPVKFFFIPVRSDFTKACNFLCSILKASSN